ncbi:hypothetical protein [Deinococcus aquaedulcis]|uniref:hypothetical protein n=1 Tax=Deinococcus aquaedulcis TaxID=2840455 RepID=UPI001C82BCC4|nr:hypothetical protein [Deinococcus aquaedulcis]
MTDPHPELDTLFAQARTLTPADHTAAARFLEAHRAAQTQARARHTRAGWLSAALGAAVVAGALMLRPAATALPASAAYDVYQSAWGEGW